MLHAEAILLSLSIFRDHAASSQSPLHLYLNSFRIRLHLALLADHCSLSESRIEDLLSDTKTRRCDLKKLVGIDEV